MLGALRQDTSAPTISTRNLAILHVAIYDAVNSILRTRQPYRFLLDPPPDADPVAATIGAAHEIMKALYPGLRARSDLLYHTSGHSTFSAAGAEVIRHFYRTDTLPFTATSDSLPGVVRTYTSLAACTDEIGMSRIYGGIHFQSANRDGKTSGRNVARYITANYLLPNETLPTLTLGSHLPATLLIHLHGQVGTSLILESTPDFLTWTAISTNLARSGGVHLQLETSDPSSHFFRIRQQAP
jgi:hypothetical protein